MRDQVYFIVLASKFMKFEIHMMKSGGNHEMKIAKFLKPLGIDISLMPYHYAIGAQKLAPLDYSAYNMIAQVPEPILPKSFFLSVFSINLWISILIMILLIIATLILHHKMFKLNAKTMINTIMDTFGLTSSNNNNIIYKTGTFSLNLTKLISSILCFFIAVCFSAFLIAEILTVKTKFPFHDLNDFWNQHEYSICSATYDASIKYLKILDPENRQFNNKYCKSYVEKNLELLDIICNPEYEKAVFLTAIASTVYERHGNRLVLFSL